MWGSKRPDRGVAVTQRLARRVSGESARREKGGERERMLVAGCPRWRLQGKSSTVGTGTISVRTIPAAHSLLIHHPLRFPAIFPRSPSRFHPRPRPNPIGTPLSAVQFANAFRSVNVGANQLHPSQFISRQAVRLTASEFTSSPNVMDSFIHSFTRSTLLQLLGLDNPLTVHRQGG